MNCDFLILYILFYAHAFSTNLRAVLSQKEKETKLSLKLGKSWPSLISCLPYSHNRNTFIYASYDNYTEVSSKC